MSQAASASPKQSNPIQEKAEALEQRRRAAQDKLVALVQSYPSHTPPDHILFGYGGRKIYLSDLWDLFGIGRG